MGLLGLLEINIFWNNGYDVITSAHNVTNKVLSRDENYILNIVMWPKLCNSGIS